MWRGGSIVPFSAVLCHLKITFLHNAKTDTGAKCVITVGFMTKVDRRTTSKKIFWSCTDLYRNCTDGNNEICLGIMFCLAGKALQLIRSEHCSGTVVTRFLPLLNIAFLLIFGLLEFRMRAIIRCVWSRLNSRVCKRWYDCSAYKPTGFSPLFFFVRFRCSENCWPLKTL